MIDLFREDLLDLRQACRLPPYLNPRTRRPPHLSAIYRHINHGARATNGERVRLEVVRTPSGLRTSREAVARFFEALTNRDPVTAPAPAARARQISRAESELSAAGFTLANNATIVPTTKKEGDAPARFRRHKEIQHAESYRKFSEQACK